MKFGFGVENFHAFTRVLNLLLKMLTIIDTFASIKIKLPGIFQCSVFKIVKRNYGYIHS